MLRRRTWGVDCFGGSYIPLGLFSYRFISDFTEQGGSATPSWRTRNPPGSQLSQGHVQRGVAQWQELVSDPSRKNSQSGAACWQETPLQVCHSLVSDLKPGLLCRALHIPVLPMLSSRSTELGAIQRQVERSLLLAGFAMAVAGGGCRGNGRWQVHVCRPEGLSTAFVSLTKTLTAVPCWLCKQLLAAL